jgi:hypothetical protein
MNRIILFICLVVCLLTSCATTKDVEYGDIKQLQYNVEPFDLSVFEVVIPELIVDNLTIDKALELFQEKWQKALAEQDPPNTIFFKARCVTQRKISDPDAYRYLPEISFAIKNIRAVEALELIIGLGGLDELLVINNSIILVYHRHWLDADWLFGLVPLTEKSKRFFNLTDGDAIPYDITDQLKQYGIKFRKGLQAQWLPSVNKILIQNTEEEVNKLKAIVAFVDSGYEIKKVPASAISDVPLSSDEEEVDISPEEAKIVSDLYDSFLTMLSGRELKKGTKFTTDAQYYSERKSFAIFRWSYYITEGELRGFKIFIPTKYIEKKGDYFITTVSLVMGSRQKANITEIMVVKEK